FSLLFTLFPYTTLFRSSPIGFLLAYFLVKRLAPYAQGSGIPQLMAAIELSTPKKNKKVDLLLGFRIILIKIGSSLLMVLSGGVRSEEHTSELQSRENLV